MDVYNSNDQILCPNCGHIMRKITRQPHHSFGMHTGITDSSSTSSATIDFVPSTNIPEKKPTIPPIHIIKYHCDNCEHESQDIE